MEINIVNEYNTITVVFNGRLDTVAAQQAAKPLSHFWNKQTGIPFSIVEKCRLSAVLDYASF